MTSKKKITIKTQEEVYIKNIACFLSSSFGDYMAARILMIHNKLIQACVLANTAIEKFLKALIEANGKKSFGKHDINKLLLFIKNQYPRLHKKLNSEFITELSKIYKTRYIDDLPISFNFAIIQSKFLAELNYTYSVLEPSLRVQEKSKIKSKYEYASESKDADLWIRNYILNNI